MKRLRVATSCLAGAGADLEKALILVGGKMDAATAREVFILGSLIKAQGYGYMRAADGHLVLSAPVDVAAQSGRLPGQALSVAKATVGDHHREHRFGRDEPATGPVKVAPQPVAGHSAQSQPSKAAPQVDANTDQSQRVDLASGGELQGSQEDSNFDQGSTAPFRPQFTEDEANSLLDQLF